jgi:hypothetical protein
MFSIQLKINNRENALLLLKLLKHLDFVEDAYLDDMNEDSFWEIIDLFDWDKTNEDEIMLDARNVLVNYSTDQIYKFQNLLSEKLYLLDGLEYSENLNKTGNPISVDEFLYIRAAIVANGKDFYEKVKQGPLLFPIEKDFEPLLYLAKKAYCQKTGKEDWNFTPEVSYETYSNYKAWNLDKPVLEF